jgi:gamma-glutamyltranspeptidase/glutathione hydrolase
MINPETDPHDSELIEGRPSPVKPPQKIAVSPYGMVAAQHHLATEAGNEILSAGGNAIDAAVAAALALGVCEPAASGLGGQTMMLVYEAASRRTVALDGSSRAPHRAIPGKLSAEDCRRGYRAATVPTTPRTLRYALRRFGTMPWPRVLDPAVRLAEEGYRISELQRRLTRRELQHLRSGSAAGFFLREGRKAYRVGERFRQPVLAETLRRLARRGVSTFYTGKIAGLIHADMITNKGLIRRDDLAQIQPPLERKPVTCHFDNMRVMTFPPPGAGRTLIEMLNIVSHLPRRLRNPDRPEGAVILARIMQRAFRDRTDRPFDPNYYAQVSSRKMLSVDYARRIARRLKTRGETTHLSVMDRFGNAVALTQSIERVYGACVATPELGFLYNNYMMAFEYDDISHPYFLRPGAVPWASVAPTIVFKGRKPWLVIGSPGSERIPTTILQVMLRLRNHDPLEAVDAPRIHCSLEGRVTLEAARMRNDIPAILRENGFEVTEMNPYSFFLGCVQMVMKDKDYFIGVADPRRDGSARGPDGIR